MLSLYPSPEELLAENRRGYLISLVRQVRQLGISIRPREPRR